MSLETDDLIGFALEDAQEVLTEARKRGAGRVSIDPDKVEQDIAKLVLTLMEFLRQLVELQAIRRVEADSLTEAQEERLGEALMRSRAQIEKMAAQFDLSPEDLRLDLGPLGRLV